MCKIFELTSNFSSYCVCFVAGGSIAWVASAVSCFILGMIAVERFLALHYHLRYHQLVTIKKVAIPVTLAWVLSIAFTISRYLTYGAFNFDLIYMVLLIINFFMIFTAYGKIYQIVKRHRCQIKTQQRSLQSTTCHSTKETEMTNPRKSTQRKVTIGQSSIQELNSVAQDQLTLATRRMATNQTKESVSGLDRCHQEREIPIVNHPKSNQQSELMSIEDRQSINQNFGEQCHSADHYASNVTATQQPPVNHQNPTVEPSLAKQQASASRIQLARYRKSTITMFLVLGLFILAYFPVLCIQTIKGTIGFKHYSLKVALELSTTFVFMNAAINPVVYCMRMVSLRRACMKLLREKSLYRPRATSNIFEKKIT